LPKLGAGRLARNDDAPEAVWHVHVPEWSEREHAPFPTRRTEYHFVAQALDDVPRGLVCDAAAGFNPEIHLLPEIIGAMGFDVVAVDRTEASLVMPQRSRVVRYRGDATRLPLLDATCIAWVCISALEHMTRQEMIGVVGEAKRVLVPGGVAIATVDEIEPAAVQALFAGFGFETGELIPFEGQHLEPRVAWCVARKGR
jgi:ubiquinone/menaquinone biosynthesis C-methylase UbiE